jgi:hypothetical protein
VSSDPHLVAAITIRPSTVNFEMIMEMRIEINIIYLISSSYTIRRLHSSADMQVASALSNPSRGGFVRHYLNFISTNAQEGQ